MSALASSTTTRRKGRAVRVLRRLPMQITIAVLLVIVVYPLIWMLFGSFKQQDEFLTEPFWAIPRTWSFDNYVSAFVEGGLGRYMLNSVLAVVPSLTLVLVIGMAAAFALEVMVWKGRGPVLLMFLAGIMIPAQMLLLPLFTIYFRLHLTGTLWPLIITYTALGLPLTVFLMATYLRAVPREIFEAATIDGAGVFRLFGLIAVPLVRNGLFTVGLVQFFFFWNDLLISLTFTNSDRLRTVQVGLLNFTGQYGAIDYGPMFAGISVNVVGTLLIYLFLNQQVMKGLASGAVKG
jgi:raffinose/stachyose/melibiose transport system permease protein